MYGSRLSGQRRRNLQAFPVCCPASMLETTVHLQMVEAVGQLQNNWTWEVLLRDEEKKDLAIAQEEVLVKQHRTVVADFHRQTRKMRVVRVPTRNIANTFGAQKLECDRQTPRDGILPALHMHSITRQTFIQCRLASTARKAIPLHTSYPRKKPFGYRMSPDIFKIRLKGWRNWSLMWLVSIEWSKIVVATSALQCDQRCLTKCDVCERQYFNLATTGNEDSHDAGISVLLSYWD